MSSQEAVALAAKLVDYSLDTREMPTARAADILRGIDRILSERPALDLSRVDALRRSIRG